MMVPCPWVEALLYQSIHMKIQLHLQEQRSTMLHTQKCSQVDHGESLVQNHEGSLGNRQV